MKLHLLSIASVALLGITLSAHALEYQEPKWKVPSRSARKKNPVPDDASAIELGKAVFTAQCVSCHGTSGVGDGVAAKDLEKHPGNLTDPGVQAQSDGALFWKITTGRAPMTAFGDTLSVEQRWQVVRYIRTLGGDKLTIAAPELKAPESLRKPLGDLFGPYDKLRQALAQGDEKAAVAALTAIKSSVESLEKVAAGDEFASAWKQGVGALEKSLAAMTEAPDLDAMRGSFAGLSTAAEGIWARFGHTLKTPLLVFECSKASKAGPARWIQTTREPGNPYLGSKESSCVKTLRGIAAAHTKDH